jgi:Ras-related protein Rab-21
VIAIAGNKIDLQKFDIAKETVDEYAKSIDAKHFYTSAKTGEGLDEIFMYITSELIKKRTLNKRKETRRIKVEKADGRDDHKKKGCC